MSVEKGYLTYDYTIEIDLEDLADRIIKEIRGYVDNYEVDMDENKLVLKCTDLAYYKLYSSPATMLDPPEEDITFESIEDIDVEEVVLAAFKGTEKIKVDVDVSDNYHFHYD